MIALLLLTAPPYVIKNDLPPRVEWEENYGYCGETSLIIAGLHFGQYCSQYTARGAASNNGPQHLKSSQLLLGVNDTVAAQKMKLKAEPWGYEKQSSPPQGTTDAFLVWMKHHVAQGHPVAIGLFSNESIFGDKGDSEYDHIVTVTGIGSFTKTIDDGMYHGTDQIYYSDNGLYTPVDDPIFYFSSPFDQFQLTRDQANDPNAPVYSLLIDPNHYGLAILGIQDDDNVTIPVDIKVSSDAEEPEIEDGSDTPPMPSPTTLHVTLKNLAPMASYNVYIYDDFDKVPTKDFNKNSSLAVKRYVITATAKGGNYKFDYPILSNETVVVRAVPTTAP